MPSQEVAKATNTGVANTADAVDGLEDMDAGDMTIPRITINHKDGVFKDAQTGEEFTSFDCIMLGLVKQRSLWPPDPVDGEGPICRSVDFETGQPDLAKWVTKHNGVTAMQQSGFNYEEIEAGNLSCANCALKEWKTHPKNGTPWCSEQFTFPVIRVLDDGGQMPALISFQKTGLKSTKQYASGFRQSQRPLYSAITRITAVHNRKGTVEYVTPSFARISDSDPSEWPRYSSELASIRAFITTPRVFDDDGETTVKDNTNQAPTQATAAPKPAPEPAPEPEPEAEVEDAVVVEKPVAVEPEPAVEAPAAEQPVQRAAPAPAPDFDDEEPF